MKTKSTQAKVYRRHMRGFAYIWRRNRGTAAGKFALKQAIQWRNRSQTTNTPL